MVSPVLAAPQSKARTAALELIFESVTKRFGPVLANDRINATVKGGSVHAFLGENGAGKSTLMKMLCGYYQPDEGHIILNRTKLRFSSPTEARRAGIGMVHQQFTLVPSMTVVENVLLGDQRTNIVLNLKRETERIAAKASEFGFSFDLKSPVWRLSMAERQKVELLKLLWRDSRILVLDEPTSQLAPFEAEDILQTVQTLAKQGCIVMLVTHHLDEIMRFADEITVLRKGKLVAHAQTSQIQADELAKLMVEDLPSIRKKQQIAGERSSKFSFKSIGLKHSNSNRKLSDLSFELFEGEILGVAGVAGSGQDEIAAILAGHLQPQHGSLKVDGKQAPWQVLKHPAKAAGFIPGDPRKCSLEELSTASNLIVRDIHKKTNSLGPFLRHRHLRDSVRSSIESFDIRPSHPEVLSGHLSGGNLQRLFLAREFKHDSSMLVAVNPTAGLDLAMSQRVRAQMIEAAEKGRSIVLISPDVNELLECSDRIAVMCAGKLVGIEPARELDSQTLGLMLGGVNASIVRSIKQCMKNNSSQAEPEVKQAVAELLVKESVWQRRLAAHLAVKIFGLSEEKLVQERAVAESDPLCLAWLTVCLYKLNSVANQDLLANRFRNDPSSYLEVLRNLMGLEDLATLAHKLKQPLPAELPSWQKTLTQLAMLLSGELLPRLDTHLAGTIELA